MKHRAGLKKLHEEGRLQRMLGIPPKTEDVHPFLTHYAQTSGTTSSKRPVDVPGPSGSVSKKRRSDGPMGAIMVNDDEVDELDSDSESDEQDMQLDGESEDDGDDSGEEEGEIVESFPNGTNGIGSAPRRSRYMSVSEDDEVLEQFAREFDPNHEEEEETETRYGINKTKTKKSQRPNAGPRENGSGSVSDSDDSIVALDAPPRSQTKPTVTRQDRRAFWAAKAQPTVHVISSDDE